MQKLQFTLKIAFTNWIHFVGFYVTGYVTLIVMKILGSDLVSDNPWGTFLLESLLGLLVLYFTYGLLILSCFFLLIILFDAVLFNLKILSIAKSLMIEWIVLVIPFLYWGYQYEYPLWYTLSISFLVTQLLRKKVITKIMAGTT